MENEEGGEVSEGGIRPVKSVGWRDTCNKFN